MGGQGVLVGMLEVLRRAGVLLGAAEGEAHVGGRMVQGEPLPLLGVEVEV